MNSSREPIRKILRRRVIRNATKETPASASAASSTPFASEIVEDVAEATPLPSPTPAPTPAPTPPPAPAPLPEPTLLAKRNPHPRDQYIVFDPVPHTYTIHGEGGYTSVTTWIHGHFSEFDADAIITKMMRSPKWPQSKYYGMSREEIKALWDANRDEAASAGTAMHYDIECYYNEMSPSNDSIEFRYFMEFERARTAAGGFGEFLRPFRTEWTVYHEEAKLAGSIDMVYEDVRDGSLQIYDWKRAKEIKKSGGFQTSSTHCIAHIPDTNYWHYTLQLNTYRQILQRKYEKKVVDLYLVVLHPDNKSGTFERVRVPILESEMDDLFEEQISKQTKHHH